VEGTELQSRDGYDIGTWHFLKTGWWILHIVAIGIVFYIGYAIGAT
jgi:hypothetical protein